MTVSLIERIVADDPAVRDVALDDALARARLPDLLAAAAELETFRREATNLYHRVRALCFLQAIFRYHVPPKLPPLTSAHIPAAVHRYRFARRFEEALDHALAELAAAGPSDALSSALAATYHALMFQTLADQVRLSVRNQRGNKWMFRVGHPADHPLRLTGALRQRDASGAFPVLTERTSVRLDLSHSAWSDIFFLAMDAPEAARVINLSVQLGVHGRDPEPASPIECYLRVIDEPVLRLVSVDLGAQAEVDSLDEMFDYARDHLGLLKAAVIAAGVVPPGLEGYRTERRSALRRLLKRLTGNRNGGIELVSRVRDIPKGSRLAVSTNLLGSLIALCMRATGQTESVTGPLQEVERRIVAARAILGEWLGGSGGGWQDSGGLWPGIKRIEGALAADGDAEFGTSRGRLLPTHTVLTDVPESSREALRNSLLLVHGGMAQNVGPILEMVTERYLLRDQAATQARRESLALTQRIEEALRAGDMNALGRATLEHFRGPLQRIVPWASNRFTECLIDALAERFGDDFLGFLMLGGMAGGGMGLFFTPAVRNAPDTPTVVRELMATIQDEMRTSVPFAMRPVVYDFRIDDEGTVAQMLGGNEMPAEYYAKVAPGLLQRPPRELSASRRAELAAFSASWRAQPELAWFGPRLLDELLPPTRPDEDAESFDRWLDERGFDRELHESIRSGLLGGSFGLAQNRLPSNTLIEDVRDEDVTRAEDIDAADRERGEELIRNGTVAVVTLAAGAASRWTQGAGVIKALSPFARLPATARHRRFVDVHLAKSRRIAREFGTSIDHVFTTSPFTDEPIRTWAKTVQDPEVGVRVSLGKSLGLRTVPTVRDLRFAWEELPQQTLDEQAQKVRDSARAALIDWARKTGEASDYRDNLPTQCVHPIGHWFEVPNLLRNGTLLALLTDRPQLRYLLLHNVDTLGATIDPALLGWHAGRGHALSFEVIPRRIDDLGGGLARVDSKVRLVEGLALPRPDDEFELRYYNSLTTWIDIDRLLATFELTREDLDKPDRVGRAIRRLGARLPTYITLKEVKKRWGHGQEDVFPIAQFEKLWGDMTGLPGVDCGFLVVDRRRGQQLKDPAALDVMARDGSLAAVSDACVFD